MSTLTGFGRSYDEVVEWVCAGAYIVGFPAVLFEPVLIALVAADTANVVDATGWCSLRYVCD